MHQTKTNYLEKFQILFLISFLFSRDSCGSFISVLTSKRNQVVIRAHCGVQVNARVLVCAGVWWTRSTAWRMKSRSSSRWFLLHIRVLQSHISASVFGKMMTQTHWNRNVSECDFILADRLLISDLSETFPHQLIPLFLDFQNKRLLPVSCWISELMFCCVCGAPCPSGQQEDEADAGGGAAGPEGAGEDRPEGSEEHERPDVGRDQPVRLGAFLRRRRKRAVFSPHSVPNCGPRRHQNQDLKAVTPPLPAVLPVILMMISSVFLIVFVISWCSYPPGACRFLHFSFPVNFLALYLLRNQKKLEFTNVFVQLFFLLYIY